ncbi:unnamed protein product [Mycena citricolor]|uniref:Uncharacterized protein n=1 Tax=Mycena citricolor TaxID=2018698 RepID=A0AAD2H1G6_9AGAR|nr:unnamed protein product [Mycena citricolor]
MLLRLITYQVHAQLQFNQQLKGKLGRTTRFLRLSKFDPFFILSSMISSYLGTDYLITDHRHLTVRARGLGIILIDPRLHNICSRRFYYNP